MVQALWIFYLIYFLRQAWEYGVITSSLMKKLKFPVVRWMLIQFVISGVVGIWTQVFLMARSVLFSLCKAAFFFYSSQIIKEI